MSSNATYPMVLLTEESLGYLYGDFCHDFGIPKHMTFDGYFSQPVWNTLFMKTVSKYDMQYHVSIPRRSNKNPVEGSIRELKKNWYPIMHNNRVPKRLWDYGLVWIIETGNRFVSSTCYESSRTPLKYITEETPNISEYLNFTFYDWFTYRENAGLG